VAEEAEELAARFPAEPAAWDKVKHLWDCGRAPERTDHPDHKLAQVLQQGFFAELPALDLALLLRLIERGLEGRPISELLGTAEFPRLAHEPAADLAALLQTDQLRAALGRIASMYDGGHLLE
jgi:hypothetical protein